MDKKIIELTEKERAECWDHLNKEGIEGSVSIPVYRDWLIAMLTLIAEHVVEKRANMERPIEAKV